MTFNFYNFLLLPPTLTMNRKVLKLLYSNFLLEGKNPLFSIRKPLENILSGGFRQMWSGRRDSNTRHLGPKPSALPG